MRPLYDPTGASEKLARNSDHATMACVRHATNSANMLRRVATTLNLLIMLVSPLLVFRGALASGPLLALAVLLRFLPFVRIWNRARRSKRHARREVQCACADTRGLSHIAFRRRTPSAQERMRATRHRVCRGVKLGRRFGDGDLGHILARLRALYDN